ncbi:very short patch repair endonuclease [Chloroflexota bacterium]
MPLQEKSNIIMDTITAQQRTRNMSRIRSKNTAPELAVRQMLTKSGVRYRLHLMSLPGKPDITIARRKTIIFINGCFWHQHENCKRRSMPKTNVGYWHNKLQRNVDRQQAHILDLKNQGWKVGIIWECQTKNEARLNDALQSILHEE